MTRQTLRPKNLLRLIPLLLIITVAGCGEVDWFPDYVRLPTTPDDFSFAAKTNTDLKTAVTSEAITVTGLTGASSPISVTGSPADANSTFSIDGGEAVTSGSVSNNQKVTVTHTSATTPGTSTVSTLTIGNVSARFVSTTKILGAFSTPVQVGSYFQAYADINSVDGVAATHVISIKDSATSGSALFAVTDINVVNPDSTVQFVTIPQTLSFINKRVFVRNLISAVNAGTTTTLTVDNVDTVVNLKP